MKQFHMFVLAAITVFTLIAAGPDDRRQGKGGGGAAVVPPYPFNVWLCRPGADSVTASVLAWQDMEVFISSGEGAEALTRRSEAIKLTAGTPVNIVLDGLKPDTRHFYQLSHRPAGGDFTKGGTRDFHTRRAAGSKFTFTTQADSHLDVSSDMKVYQQTLANMLADKPDFMVDLGDTTMVDKFGTFHTRAESQYLAQRYYIGGIAHSVPVLLTLGNHDGEQGFRLTGEPNSMPLLSVAMRKKFFPNPEPGGIYTGNATPQDGAGLLQDHYAWEWGSALFVVLDPFWFTRDRKGDDNWGMTLGEAQYHWLTKTLETSKAPFKFIFIHHLVGGLGRDVRGGVTPAPYMEWGGKNADGTDGFAQHRPGWEMPIHPLLVKHGVSIVFHGHDHLFAKEELNGIIYQEVPQPSHPNGGTRSAGEYGYTGVILGSSGHLRVTVDTKETVVEYVRAGVPGITKDNVANGSVAHRYSITPRPTP
jgi:predicted phosphodiesterase